MKKYKKVWILYTSGISLFLGILLFCISENILLEDQQTDKPFFQIAFMAIIFAPIIEEILFRGYFSNKKVIKWVSIILLPIFVVLTSLIIYQLQA
ncbi:CPBP family glutamic-type intramembrane protease [Hanstruepera marina]|uniref:CPBP family glutamic-type intramembrane protease n=1 Tax=Hanstruepera marina TaxID=2873265 RepID=UPI0034E2E8A5